MPTLETAGGRALDITPPDTDAINLAFENVLADDGPDKQAPPKRQPRTPAADVDKPKRQPRAKADQSRTIPAAAVTLTDQQRENGVKGLAQLGAAIVMMLGKSTHNTAYEADAMTIINHADDLAAAAAEVARADAAFAARLDRICSAGPYGALIGVTVAIGAQIARNHKPALAIPGTVAPGELLAPATA